MIRDKLLGWMWLYILRLGTLVHTADGIDDRYEDFPLSGYSMAATNKLLIRCRCQHCGSRSEHMSGGAWGEKVWVQKRNRLGQCLLLCPTRNVCADLETCDGAAVWANVPQRISSSKTRVGVKWNKVNYPFPNTELESHNLNFCTCPDWDATKASPWGSDWSTPSVSFLVKIALLFSLAITWGKTDHTQTTTDVKTVLVVE